MDLRIDRPHMQVEFWEEFRGAPSAFVNDAGGLALVFGGSFVAHGITVELHLSPIEADRLCNEIWWRGREAAKTARIKRSSRGVDREA